MGNSPSGAIAAIAARNGSSAKSCEPMWMCRPRRSRPADRADAIERGGRVVEADAELRVGLAGRDLLVGVAAHARGDAQQDRLAARRRPAVSRSRRSMSSAPSMTMWPTPASSDMRSSASSRALPWWTIFAGVKAGAQREMQLARGGDVAAEALLREERHHRGGGEGLRREDDLDVVVAGGVAQRVAERAGARAQVVLRDDVGGRAEALGELEHVAAADLQAPAVVDAAADRVHVGEGARRCHRAAIIAVRRRGARHRGLRQSMVQHEPQAQPLRPGHGASGAHGPDALPARPPLHGAGRRADRRARQPRADRS